MEYSPQSPRRIFASFHSVLHPTSDSTESIAFSFSRMSTPAGSAGTIASGTRTRWLEWNVPGRTPTAEIAYKIDASLFMLANLKEGGKSGLSWNRNGKRRVSEPGGGYASPRRQSKVSPWKRGMC